MRATFDHFGRLVIPRKILHKAGIEAGTPLEIRLQDGRIEIEQAALALKLVKRGRLWVAVPTETTAPLTSDDVEKTRDRLRDRWQLQRGTASRHDNP